MTKEGVDRDKEQLLPNAFMAVTQTLVTASVLFLLYHYLVRELGLEAVGLWSLVLSTTSFGRISELGMSGSATRYVSKHLATNDPVRAAEVLQTILLSVAASLGLFSVMLFPLAVYILSLLMENASLEQSVSLLPFALVSLWFNGLALAAQAALDGCHRADLRALVAIAASILMLALSYQLVPIYGLKGMAYAQICQGAATLILSWLLLRRYIQSLPVVPSIWTKSAFSEIFRYAAGFQLMDFCRILTDPITKSLLGYFGTLEALGYYEMANRMVIKAREIVVSANKVTTPYFSKLAEIKSSQINTLYRKHVNLVVTTTTPIFFGVGACLAGISQVWLGDLSAFFLAASFMLLLGWFINSLSAPAYFAVMGSSDIRPNVAAHLSQSLSNIVLCSLFGWFWGGLGVVLGWACSLAVSSLTLVIAFHRRARVTAFRNAWSNNTLVVTTSGLGVVVSSTMGAILHSSISGYYLLALQILVFAACTLPALLRHGFIRKGLFFRRG